MESTNLKLEIINNNISSNLIEISTEEPTLGSEPTLLEIERERLAEESVKKLINEHKNEKLMTSPVQLKRLLNTNFANPYDILMLGVDSSDEEIRRQYRQLSMLVHPDKCNDPKAADAFHSKLYILTNYF